MKRHTSACSVHLQTYNLKFHWKLPWPRCIDLQFRPFAYKLIDNDFRLSCLGAHVVNLLSIFPWRDIQLQSFEVYGLNGHGRTEQIQPVGGESKFSNRYQRLDTGVMSVRISYSISSQSLARNLNPSCDCDVEPLQLTIAFET